MTRAPGEKFADADLIGARSASPSGKKSLEDGEVDVRDRATGEETRLALSELGKKTLTMARRRRFSEEPFGPTIERLMDGDRGHLPGAGRQDGLSAGYLNHLVHGNRPVPSNDVVRRLQTRSASSRSTSASSASA